MRPYARYPTRKGGDFFIRVGPAHMHLTNRFLGALKNLGGSRPHAPPTTSCVNHFLVENKLFFS